MQQVRHPKRKAIVLDSEWSVQVVRIPLQTRQAVRSYLLPPRMEEMGVMHGIRS